MTALNYLPALYLSLALATANAQTPQPAPAPSAGDQAKPPARETPPDQKAFADAGKLTDPEQKVAAYEKLKKDFPAGVYASIADNAILSTLLKSLPDQKDRLRKTADRIYKTAIAKDKEASKSSVIVTTRRR